MSAFCLFILFYFFYWTSGASWSRLHYLYSLTCSICGLTWDVAFIAAYDKDCCPPSYTDTCILQNCPSNNIFFFNLWSCVLNTVAAASLLCVLVFSVLSLVNMWWAAACNELHRTWQLKSTLFEIQYNHIHITAPIDTSVLVIPVIVFFHCTSLYLSYIVYTETPVRNILTLCLLEYKKWRIVHDAQWLIQNNVYYVTKLFPQPKRLCIHRCPFVCLLVCQQSFHQRFHQFLREWRMNFDGKFPSH